MLNAVGRTLISLGVLVLLFVAYQLWGTGIRHAQAQDDLEDEFEIALGEIEKAPPARPGATTTTTTPPPPPASGDAAARLVIPSIGVNEIVVEGVTVDDLKRGPGHYPETPLPGQKGNAAIAGHRTTYGAPFNRLDELRKGDEILVTTLQGSFRYEVAGTNVVEPTAVEVLDDKGDNRLTLTACHPKYSARQRIIAVATLSPKSRPVVRPQRGDDPTYTRAEAPERFESDLDGESAGNWPAIWTGLLAAAVGLGAWLLGKRWRKWPAYLLSAPVFLVVLFFFFENFGRLLPSNF